MGVSEIHPWILRELAGEVTEMLPSYLKGHGNVVKFPVIGKGETMPTLKKGKKKNIHRSTG